MFKYSSECYQAIGMALSNSTKETWDCMSLLATLDDTKVEIIIECWLNHNLIGYITDVPCLAEYIYDLARLVSTEEKGIFKECKFTLHHDGKFKADFVY